MISIAHEKKITENRTPKTKYQGRVSSKGVFKNDISTIAKQVGKVKKIEFLSTKVKTKDLKTILKFPI